MAWKPDPDEADRDRSALNFERIAITFFVLPILLFALYLQGKSWSFW